MKKRALVTGAAGFIGSHFLRYMIEKHPDWEFVVVDRLSYAGALSRISDLDATQVKFVLHDIRAYPSDYVRSQIGAVDYVFHLAAETHVDRSTRDPEIFVQTNVVGTYNLLEYCRREQPGLTMFFLVSTDEVYGAAPHGVDHTEDFPHRPSNVYSATKAAAEDLAYAYNHSMGVPVIVTNTMNTIGITQDAEKFVPKILRALIRGETVEIHGSAENPGSRKYLHARDHASALNFLVSFGERGHRYNVVGAEEITNKAMFDLVAEQYEACCFHTGAVFRVPIWKYVDFHSARPGHDLRYSLDGHKLAMLGWVPKISIAQTILQIVNYTMEHPEWLG